MTLASKVWKPLIGAEGTCKLMVSKMDEQRSLYLKIIMRNKTSIITACTQVLNGLIRLLCHKITIKIIIIINNLRYFHCSYLWKK